MYLNIIKKKYNNDEKSINFEVYKQGLLTEKNIGKKKRVTVLCCVVGYSFLICLNYQTL